MSESPLKRYAVAGAVAVVGGLISGGVAAYVRYKSQQNAFREYGKNMECLSCGEQAVRVWPFDENSSIDSVPYCIRCDSNYTLKEKCLYPLILRPCMN